LTGLFALRSVEGDPINDSEGRPQAFRLGLARYFILSTGPRYLGDPRPLPAPQVAELARDGASLLYELPAPVALSVWRNWQSGFSRQRNCSEYLWLDALFELSWQRPPGDVLQSKRFAQVGNLSIGLVGGGLFPRIPYDFASRPGGSIPHDHGHPTAYHAKLADVARASVIAIDEILERETTALNKTHESPRGAPVTARPAASNKDQPMNTTKRDKVFVSYSHKDKKLFDEFKTMLAPAIRDGIVDLWDDTEIKPGAKWKNEIQAALGSAKVAVLLVSQQFLASDFIAKHELPPLLKAVQDEGVTVFWIYLSSCLYEQTEIATYQAAHDVSKPLDRLDKPHRQAVLSEICAKLVQLQRPGVRPSLAKTTAPPTSEAPVVCSPAGRPRVYISYAWREKLGAKRALHLADRLREAGFDARIDRYNRKGLHGFTAPPLLHRGENAWTRWQEEQIRDADRVLVICGPEYANSSPDSGVARDLLFMEEDLKRPDVELRKFIPVGFAHYVQNKQNIPPFLQGANYFNLGRGSKIGGLKDLIRHFRNEFPLQAGVALAQGTSPLPRDPDSTPATGDGVQANRKSRQPTSSMQPPIDFVIITPLEEEREAMLLHLGMPKRFPPTADDIRVYYPATVPVTFSDGTKSEYRVVLTDLLGMGRLEAANAVGDAIRRWRPKFIILVGIAGGLAKAGVSVGDVLISEQIADYELQKLTPKKTQIRWSVHRANPRMLGAAKQLRPEDWRPLIRAARPVPGESRRHAGPICTGDKVIANRLMNQYRDVWTKLIGVEMEAGGAASGAFQAPEAPGFFMVRGVSDLADAKKDNAQTQSWRAYACDIAAAYVEALLKSGPVLPIAQDAATANPQ
jgi:nucleoside phosphorylase